MRDNELIEEAVGVLANAYAPYSGYKVSAALLTQEGQIFKGVNVENISYGLTICAERNALFTALTQGYNSFVTLAVVTDGKIMPVPCGACRQVLSEFSRELKIIIQCDGKEKHRINTSLEQLFPHPFCCGEELKE